MDRVQRSIVERIRRYGLRVMCASCANVDRHFPQNGRLRDARCKRCGGELRSVAWIDKDAERGGVRWAELVKRTHGRLRPFVAL